MSLWQKIYYGLLKTFIHLLVKSKVIPVDPITELGLDVSRPILYVLPYRSIIDLLSLRKQCLLMNLPDPLLPLKIAGISLPSHVFIDNKPTAFQPAYAPEQDSIRVFHHYLDLHRHHVKLDIQLLPVSVMFGRSPGRKDQMILRLLNNAQKCFAVFWLGRDSFVRFSKTVSLRRMAINHGTDKIIAHKLARVARIHFSRQHLATIGPGIPLRRELFKKLLASKAIEKAVAEEARNKKISHEKAQRHAITLMEEIAANFSYEMIRLFDRILTWTWNRLYQGISVHNIEQVRQLAQSGHEIVYLPCHRSHMDYLLLSYVLYHHGLVPPHIAAGINLNFWPAGAIFRRLGAFFIRRSFKGSKLYAIVFREYLRELFNRGYSVEYFIEGGRSRTGRLLVPKTGTLLMTIQAMLWGATRQITLVPVYIGYEHVMEISSYTRELSGAVKEKENLFQMIRSLRKLRNLGYGYVNFGEPIPLTTWFNNTIPHWRKSIDSLESQRPSWLPHAVDELAQEVMTRINNAAAANAINLCSTALLASNQHSLTREQLLAQLNCYLQLLRHVPCAPNTTVPNESAQTLLDHALSMNKFEIRKDSSGDIITLPHEQAVLMTWYRNNIQHLLILPSLIATALVHHHRITRRELFSNIAMIYPIIRAELFLHYQKDQLSAMLNRLTDELARQQLVNIEEDEWIVPAALPLFPLQLLAAGANETLQRYAITFSLLKMHPEFTRNELLRESQTMAKRLSVLHGINTPEFFDKAVFSTLITILHQEGYITDDHSDSKAQEQIVKCYHMLSELLEPEIRLTIESTTTTT